MKKGFFLIIVIIIVSSVLSFVNVQKDDDIILSHIVNLKEQTLKLYWKDDNNTNFLNFSNLKNWLHKKGEKMVFATNGGMYLKDRLDLVVGLLYNQKGSAVSVFNPKRGSRIYLNYMEVPLMIRFKTKKAEERKKGRKKIQQKEQGYLVLEAGVSYAKLINYSIEEYIQRPRQEISFERLSGAFKDDEFNAIMGFNYFFTRNVGFGFNCTFQLNKVYANPLLNDSTAPEILSTFNNDPNSKVILLKNYQIAFQVVYNFL